MANNANFSITADVLLDLKNIQKQLDGAAKKYKFNLDSSSVSTATKDVNKLEQATEKASGSAENMGLTFQEANLIMQRSIEVIVSMVEQVYELDGAITEFRKVSELSGKSLDNYVAKLSDMGSQVARTGKPKRLARKVRMVNVL